MANLKRTYAGFISYSSVDGEIARWLHRRLERYSVPKSLRVQDGGSRSLGRFFLDREEFAAAISLPDQIRAALANSQCLIVICSPHAANSKWVNDEITEFCKLGKPHRVFVGVVAGFPPACFPASLREPEPIAADFREEYDGREDGFLKLVAGILDVPFGMLKDREARAARRKRLILSGVLALFVVLFLAAGAGLIAAWVYSEKASQLALAAIDASGQISDAALELALNANADASGTAKLVRLSENELEKLYAYGVEVDELKHRHAWTLVRLAHASLMAGDNESAETHADRAYEMVAPASTYKGVQTAATAQVALSEARLRQRDLIGALNNADRAVLLGANLVALADKNDYQPQVMLAEALEQRCAAQMAATKDDEAMKSCREALQIYRQLSTRFLDSATFPWKISDTAEQVASLAERQVDAKLEADMRLESTRAYMRFLSYNKGRVELHQKALEIAVRAAEVNFGLGDQSATIEALRNAENAMLWLWDLDMTDEAVMQNRERARAMLQIAEEGGDPFAKH